MDAAWAPHPFTAAEGHDANHHGIELVHPATFAGERALKLGGSKKNTLFKWEIGMPHEECGCHHPFANAW